MTLQCQRRPRGRPCPELAVVTFALPRLSMCGWHAYTAMTRRPALAVQAIHDRREALWLAGCVPAMAGLVDVVPGGRYL